MDLNFFTDPGLAPKARSEITIELLEVRPYPDGHRLQVELHITPFLPNDRPSILITMLDSTGKIIASTNIIEAIQYSMHITMHLPQQFHEKELAVQTNLYFGDEPPQASATKQVLLTEMTEP